MGPDMVTNPNAAQMILKYVLPSATCNIEDVRKTLGVTATPAPRKFTFMFDKICSSKENNDKN